MDDNTTLIENNYNQGQAHLRNMPPNGNVWAIGNILASVFFQTTTTLKTTHGIAFVGFQTDRTEAKPKNGFF